MRKHGPNHGAGPIPSRHEKQRGISEHLSYEAPLGGRSAWESEDHRGHQQTLVNAGSQIRKMLDFNVVITFWITYGTHYITNEASFRLTFALHVYNLARY